MPAGIYLLKVKKLLKFQKNFINATGLIHSNSLNTRSKIWWQVLWALQFIWTPQYNCIIFFIWINQSFLAAKFNLFKINNINITKKSVKKIKVSIIVCNQIEPPPNHPFKRNQKPHPLFLRYTPITHLCCWNRGSSTESSAENRPIKLNSHHRMEFFS